MLYSFEEIQSDYRDTFYVLTVTPSREGDVVIEGLLYREETYAGDTATVGSTQRVQKRIESYGN